MLSRAVVWKFSSYLLYKEYLESNKEHLPENLVDVYSQRFTVDISFSYIYVWTVYIYMKLIRMFITQSSW